MTEPSRLAALIEPVARILLGEPNRALSSKTELRFGSHGSVSVDLKKGTWYDHEVEEGGGTLDLIQRQTGLREAERFEWLERNTDYRPEERPHRGGNGADGKLGQVVATYQYLDDDGTLLFEVLRFEPKNFRQRAPDGKWSVKGIKQVPYRLPELMEALANQNIVFIVEGEKDVENLRKLGVPATCNAGGAGKWRSELTKFFAGADVVLIPDNDPQKKNQTTGELMFHPDGRPILPGQDHMREVAQQLYDVAGRIRLLELPWVWPSMPLKGDITDWLKEGHGSAEQLYDIIGKLEDWAPPVPGSTPTPPPALIGITFPFPIDGPSLPRRPWIVPGLLLRRQVSVTVAPPGSGKSLLTLQLGMVCAAGINTWPFRPRGKFRVLIINGEEDVDELRRRLWAAREHMGLSDEQLSGLAFADETEDLVVARADSRTKTVTRTPMLERIVATIIAQAFDIVIVDPFAETFAGDENSNSELKWAAVLWREVARRTNAAVLLIHHTKKYAHDMAGDPDAGRGAGALVGVARIVSTLFTMTEAEAERFNVAAEDRRKFIRYDDAKANLNLMSPSARWFEKKTVTLPNAGDGEPADEVGVLDPWVPPDALKGLTAATAVEILKVIDRGLLDADGNASGDRYTLTRRGAKNKRWAGLAIQQFFPCEPEDATKLLKTWIKNGIIAEVTEPTSTSNSQPRQGLRVLKYPGVITEEHLGQRGLELHP